MGFLSTFCVKLRGFLQLFSHRSQRFQIFFVTIVPSKGSQHKIPNCFHNFLEKKLKKKRSTLQWPRPIWIHLKSNTPDDATTERQTAMRTPLEFTPMDEIRENSLLTSNNSEFLLIISFPDSISPNYFPLENSFEWNVSRPPKIMCDSIARTASSIRLC